jgi:hypothetical protein
MNRFGLCIPAALAVFLIVMAWGAPPADAGFLYKSYLVKQDRGREILCDPYIVKKNDYVLKLLRQKGEIAAEDFPEFLAVFKRVNPHIRDINLIRPGQQIFIPLRVLRSNEMPGQASGVVTIPYVTIGRQQAQAEGYIQRYRVQKGDCVSKLIAGRFGRYGSADYWEGVRLFRMMNPTVTDLDLIYAGRMLRLPEASVKKAPWYAAAVGNPESSDVVQHVAAATRAEDRKTASGSPEPSTPLATAAEALGAVLLDRGTYFFPRPGGKDFRLDLSRAPALEFPDGYLTLLPEIDSPARAELEMLDPFPAKTDIAAVSRQWDAQRIIEKVLAATGRARPLDRLVVSDSGIRVEIRARWITGKTIDDTGQIGRICILPIEDCAARTPEPIVRYLEEQDVLLREVCENDEQTVRHRIAGPARCDAVRIESADRRSLVREVLTALGCRYTSNVSISFPYAGMKVHAQTNLAALPDGREFLVDFGDLYGDAIAAIERAGFSVVQIVNRDRRKILRTLIKATGRPFQQDPTLWAVQRDGPYNVSVTFVGFLVEGEEDRRVLLAEAALHHRLVDFLSDRGVQVVQVGFPDNAGAS